jgi:thiosulfate/3-mercaptopyruvate sulfurtransferase
MSADTEGPLISPAELAELAKPANNAGCAIFDCRFSLFDRHAGSQVYAAAHIPGAHFIDLERDLSAEPGAGAEAGGRHPLPDRATLAARLRSFGVRRDSTVVCYDQNAGAVAARLWWLVRWLGHAKVRVLDGGLDAWIAAGLPVTAGIPTPVPGDFAARKPLTRSCTARELPNDQVNLLDAREPERYRGEAEPIDPVAGHVPGAISAPFAGNLADGRFRSRVGLAARFRELGLDPDKDTVCYCGSGVTAAHNIIALLVAGHPEPALYAGSWSEWITDPERPIATGSTKAGAKT